MMRVGWLLAFVLTAAAWAADGGLMHYQIINRDSDGWPFTKIYYTYVVSNLPQETVMPALCRDALLRRHKAKPHCTYLPLARVGHFGGKLLPFDPLESRELVVVVDRATLTAVDTDALARLQAAYFPTRPAPGSPEAVLLFLQNSGNTMKENQVLVSLPAARWLTAAADALWALPSSTLPDGSRRTKTIERRVGRSVILSNEAETREALRAALPFHDVTTFDLAETDAFLAAKADQRIVALNWNGDAPIAPALAARLLPAALQDETKDTPPAAGLTRWQRFCLPAVAQAYPDGAGTRWLLRAPTARHLKRVAQQAIDGDFAGGPYTLPLADLTAMQTPAVGVFLPVTADGPSRLDDVSLQRGLEEQATATLNVRVPTLAATPEWPEALAGALNPDPLADAAATNLPRLQKYTTGDTLLLFWVKRARATTDYAFPNERLREETAVFGEAEPVCPLEPDPEEVIVVGTYRFPGHSRDERRQSHEYQVVWKRWHDDDMAHYHRKHRDWEVRYEVWKREHWHRRIHYRYLVQATGHVEVTGYLRVIDLRTGQQVASTQTFTGQADGEARTVGEVPAWVDDDHVLLPPRELRDYAAADTWRGCERILGADAMARLYQKALQSAFNTTAKHLADNALRAGDIKAWNQAAKEK
jgi:hypothetical protein